MSTPSRGTAGWNVEDAPSWEALGKKIAWRNLWISVACLLCAFAVWSYWSVITVRMRDLGFPFTAGQLFTLTAVAGLTGATLRIPNAFLVALAGGRNVTAVTTALLLVPAVGAGMALQDRGTPYAAFVVLAALSGIGGGSFASSMANISLFFPKRIQGTALGLNAGLGNLGVSVMQAVLPVAMTVPLFGAWGGGGLPLPGGGEIWIQNCGFLWAPVLGLLAFAAWFGMDNLPVFPLSPAPLAVVKILALNLIGFAGAAAGLWALMGAGLGMWVALPLTVAVTLGLMKLVRGPAAHALKRQFAIFRSKHNWIMTWLYVMTFGSFIGYAMAFPLLISVVFDRNPFAWAWLGPLVGSVIRPAGGWLADRWGGARVTQWATAGMIAAVLGAAYTIGLARASSAPGEYFAPFLLLFLALFVGAGIGNGSTFRMIPIIFEPAQAGPVLGWTSAVAAYGAFIVPTVFGSQIEAGHPERALYGFAAYYVTCLVLNWWYYARKGAEVSC